MSFKRDSVTNQFILTENFKMPKSVKRTLSTIGNKDLRDQWRNVMAQSVAQSFEILVKEKKEKGGK